MKAGVEHRIKHPYREDIVDSLRERVAAAK
jgi:hypothetical protein